MVLVVWSRSLQWRKEHLSANLKRPYMAKNWKLFHVLMVWVAKISKLAGSILAKLANSGHFDFLFFLVFF
jgi:hypothetical protein